MTKSFWLPLLIRLAGWCVTVRCRLRVTGLEHLRTAGPLILAANHVSNFDPVVLMWLGYRFGRPIRPLALSDLFRLAYYRPLLKTVDAIPVYRGAGREAGLDVAVEALRAGHCVLIYPEGTVPSPGTTLPARPGVGHLVRGSGAPVVPVTSCGLGPSDSTGWRRWFRTPAAVVVGAPLDLPVQAAPHDIATRVLECVRDQLPVAHRLRGRAAMS